MMNELHEKINCIRLNQEQDMFIVGLDSGVRAYFVDPLNEVLHTDPKMIKGVGICEMLNQTTWYAFTAKGESEECVIRVYDHEMDKFLSEIEASSPVLDIRLQNGRLIIVEKDYIHVFNFPNVRVNLFSCPTGDNPKGLCAASIIENIDREIICFPATQQGSVQIVNARTHQDKVSQSPVIFHTHNSPLAYLAVNRDGSLLATASKKGTLIRVWDTEKQTKLVELRRGSDPATIYCINFSIDNDFLCCSSDKGTIHIFAIKDVYLNKRSSLKSIGFAGSYGESHWSVCTFTVPPECACICGFGPNSTIFALGLDGTYHKYTYSADDSTCSRVMYDEFLEICNHVSFD